MVKSLTGQRAEVRWGHRRAAALGSWRLDVGAEGGTFRGQIAQRDDFAVTQTPLVLVVPAGQSQWRWPLRGVQVSGDTLTASVDPRSE